MDEIWNKITGIISEFKSDKFITEEKLIQMQRGLSYCHFKLTEININDGKIYSKIMYEFKGSAAAAKIKAEFEVPELRMTRKILFATSKVIDAVRSEIAILRTEN